MDSEGNIRLGDFGLATKRTEKVDISRSEDSSDLFETAEANAVYDAIEDISPLMVTSPHTSITKDPHHSSTGESMTGGVGTTFYRAPEQEGRPILNKKRGNDGSYNVQADIFSLGVILFEMFFPPFDTVSIACMRATIAVLETNLIFRLILFYSHETVVHGTISNVNETTRRYTNKRKFNANNPK